MDELKITIIGKDLFEIVKEKIELAGINTINQAKNGMLGNLTTLTIFCEIDQSEVIEKRKKFMKEVKRDNMRLMGLYVQDDWMRIVIMKPFRL